jgi:hypothetical protein
MLVAEEAVEIRDGPSHEAKATRGYRSGTPSLTAQVDSHRVGPSRKPWTPMEIKRGKNVGFAMIWTPADDGR